MARISQERLAQISIAGLFLVLLRTLGEYYRLRFRLGPDQGFRAFEPFIPGLVLGIAGAALAVALYFASRFRLVAWVTGLILLALLLYKIIFIPFIA